MPNKKISQFAVSTSLSGTELIPIVQLGVNKTCTVDDIRGTIGKDEGITSLTANVPKHIAFSKTLSSLVYIFTTKYAYESTGDEALVKITTRTKTGFWAMTVVDATFEWGVKVL